MRDQPRTPAGSPDGGQFAAGAGSESTNALPDLPPSKLVVVRGGIGYADADVTVVDLDYLDSDSGDFTSADVGSMLVDAAFLDRVGHRSDADRVRALVNGLPLDVTCDDMPDPIDQARDLADSYAVIEGGLVQCSSDDVAVIDMDLTDSNHTDGDDLQAARDYAEVARAHGNEALARELQDWELAEAHLLATNSGDAGMLDELATHAAPEVRAAVASNPSTPGELTAALAKDPEPGVRWAVANAAAKVGDEIRARKGAVDMNALLALVNDPDNTVSAAATKAWASFHPDSVSGVSQPGVMTGDS